MKSVTEISESPELEAFIYKIVKEELEIVRSKV